MSIRQNVDVDMHIALACRAVTPLLAPAIVAAVSVRGGTMTLSANPRHCSTMRMAKWVSRC